MATEWVKRWGFWIASKPSRPGIYRAQEGGYLVRSRVKHPKTGKRHLVMRRVNVERVEAAQQELDALKRDKAEELAGRRPQRQLYSDYAVSRLEARVAAGDIKSVKGLEKCKGILKDHLLPYFGNMACDEIRVWDVDRWRAEVADKIANGYDVRRLLRNGTTETRRILLSPTTGNTWVAQARAIGADMAHTLELERNPFAKLRPFDTSQRPTYTDERPNSLRPDQAREFLAEMRRSFPQHYAMTLAGFVTGKRPSTLRPIRAEGAEADVDWVEGFVRFRRSHTRGDVFMVGTKTLRHERVYLPDVVMHALREHRALLADPPRSSWGKGPLWWRPEMVESELLFPGRDGGPRSPSCLDKPFQAVSRAIGLPYILTPRAMRRTCNDLCRAAKVDAVVTRSITGHLTEDMRIHYSTAEANEQRQALAKVIDLFGTRKAVSQ